jgi:sphingolipid delta-4 desaturase
MAFTLPCISRSAPEFYENLISHKSWTKLLLKFLFDHELSLFSRMVRTNRSEVVIN